jgi:ubiquinone/menaquinone biosynthesis C-methylase UbiE
VTWKYTDEYYKNYTRETWDECAEKYIPILQQLIPYHSAMLEVIRPHSNEVVLDVCTGPGEPAMTIASMVSPGGRVVGIDLSEKMMDTARKSAAKRGLRNVEFMIMDAEKLEFPEERFELVVSCFGFQIVTDPQAAAKEIFRVLKPGGRAGFTVWSTAENAPAIDVIIAPMLENATPDEDGYLPTPYELGGSGELAGMLEKIGFEARERRVTGTWTAPSVEHYLEMILQGTPLGHSLSEEDKQVQETVLEKTKRNIAKYLSSDGVRIPCECVIVAARKPRNSGI